MSHADEPKAAESASSRVAPHSVTDEDVAAVRAFIQALAQRAQEDRAFAAQLAHVLRESGLGSLPARTVRGVRGASTKPKGRESPVSAPDPFRLLREGGESHLRATLRQQPVPALRHIVRTHRLDPARVSARWSAPDRLIDLIVERVSARANHGRAFERV